MYNFTQVGGTAIEKRNMKKERGSIAFRPALPYSLFMSTGDIEALCTSWDELVQEVSEHSIRLEMIQNVSIWSVLYPEVKE